MLLPRAALAALAAVSCAHAHAQPPHPSIEHLPALHAHAVAASANAPAQPAPVTAPRDHADAIADDVARLHAPASVRAAIRDAWQGHPDFRITQARLAAADARVDAAAQSVYNPELAFERENEGPDRTTTAGLDLTLDLGGKRHARRDAAVARQSLSRATARLRRRDFANQWLTAWVEVETAGKRVATGERRLALLQRFATLAERQFAADDISGLDRDVALLARDQALAEHASLLGERAEARARFETLGDNRLAANSPVLPDAAPPEPHTSAATSLAQLPESRIANANRVSAERNIRVAERNRIPDPTIGLRGGRIDYGPLQDNVVSLSISVPLFVRNDYQAEVVAARAEADEAVAQGDKIRTQLAAQRAESMESYRVIRDAWTRWQSSRGTDMDRRAELLERLWREGELSNSDYLLQLNQTLDTAFAGIALQSRLWRSYIRYLVSAGQLERWSGLEDMP